jgi:flavin reductase (DIM6/NTAB) family NADH-FMN oxidoreductase RutF
MSEPREPDPAGVDPDAFRVALSALPSGVVIVTTWLDGRPWGMTVSACCSISVEPPRVLVSLRRGSVTHDQVHAQGRLGIDILGSDHKEVAELAARPGSPKFLDEHCVEVGEGEVPQIRGALCHLACRLTETFPVGDHALVIAGVEAIAGAAIGVEPLVYFDRGYRRLGARL